MITKTYFFRNFITTFLNLPHNQVFVIVNHCKQLFPGLDSGPNVFSNIFCPNFEEFIENINCSLFQNRSSKPLLNSSTLPFIQGFDGAMNIISIPTYNASLTNRLKDLGCLKSPTKHIPLST